MKIMIAARLSCNTIGESGCPRLASIYMTNFLSTLRQPVVQICGVIAIAAISGSAADVRFEVASIKISGTPESHTTGKNGSYTMNWQPLEYKGNRVVADAPLVTVIQFAYSLLVVPYRQEVPDWMRSSFYRIDALAPKGSTLDEVRVMVQHLLVERLDLHYHLKQQTTRVLILSQGDHKPKLLPATESDPKPQVRNTWIFAEKAATIGEFAQFLSSVANQEVVDHTNISGKYSFNIDLSTELSRDHDHGLGLAIDEARRLGLTLKSGQESRTVLVIDRANRAPTAN